MSDQQNYPQLLRRLKRRGLFRIQPGLDRISQILGILGHPQSKIKTVHVAGTNGKGSVCASLESTLRAAGYRTGLYTSPELAEVRERIRIQGRRISEDDFLRTAQLVLNAERIARLRLTYFEFLTVMAFYIFARQKVDIAVIEVGLGGRWDATNVLRSPEVCVITSIGLDHTQWLGETREQIAAEKAGIIKPGVDLISGVDGIPGQIIRAVARQRRARLHQLGKDFHVSGRAVYWEDQYQTVDYLGAMYRKAIPVSLVGLHQKSNAGVTLATLEALLDKGWRISDRAIRQGLRQVQWPGRWELIPHRGPKILCDGAHNPHGISQLLATLAVSPWSGMKTIFVVGGYKDKDSVTMARLMAPKASKVYTCTLPGKRALSARAWAARFREFDSHLPICSVSNPCDALSRALAQAPSESLVIVTGSLALVGLLRSSLMARAVRQVHHV